MIYVMHPLGEVHPVRVEPEESITALADALDALGLVGDDLIDESWLAGVEPTATADGRRLTAAAARYRDLTPNQIASTLAESGAARSAADRVEGFFAFVDDVHGPSLVVERQR